MKPNTARYLVGQTDGAGVAGEEKTGLSEQYCNEA